MGHRSRRLVAAFSAAVSALALGACADEGELTHGTVKVQFNRSEAEVDNPFLGTELITINMRYEECLRDFYTNNPEYQQDGVEGAKIFGAPSAGGEGWQERLCDDPVASQVECEVVTIEQRLDRVPQLSVTYRVLESDIEAQYVRFGPIPTEDLVDCEGSAPIVSLDPNSVAGTTDDGTVVWTTLSFSPNDAKTDQGQAIRIRAASASRD